MTEPTPLAPATGGAGMTDERLAEIDLMAHYYAVQGDDETATAFRELLAALTTLRGERDAAVAVVNTYKRQYPDGTWDLYREWQQDDDPELETLIPEARAMALAVLAYDAAHVAQAGGDSE